jgi:hypothetical protein
MRKRTNKTSTKGVSDTGKGSKGGSVSRPTGTGSVTENPKGSPGVPDHYDKDGVYTGSYAKMISEGRWRNVRRK